MSDPPDIHLMTNVDDMVKTVYDYSVEYIVRTGKPIYISVSILGVAAFESAPDFKNTELLRVPMHFWIMNPDKTWNTINQTPERNGTW